MLLLYSLMFCQLQSWYRAEQNSVEQSSGVHAEQDGAGCSGKLGLMGGPWARVIGEPASPSL